jgi:phosphoglycolate phosphatase-like HAD superfamily hydrolase
MPHCPRPRFHPLSLLTTPSSSSLSLEGVIFDVDGTLTIPQPWMFTRMRALLSIPENSGVDILAHVRSLPTDAQRLEAMELVREVETEAMREMVLQSGAEDLILYLEEKRVRKGILTRNYLDPVYFILYPPPSPNLQEED